MGSVKTTFGNTTKICIENIKMYCMSITSDVLPAYNTVVLKSPTLLVWMCGSLRHSQDTNTVQLKNVLTRG